MRGEQRGRRWARAVASAVLGLAGAALVGLPASADEGPLTLAVSGPLVTVVADDFRAGRSTTTTSVSVGTVELQLSAGVLGELPAHGTFTGTVTVPERLARRLGGGAGSGSPVAADSVRGTALLRALVEEGRPAAVTSGSVTPQVLQAQTPSAHHAYVAIMTNAGDFGMTTAQLTALVDEATSFWVEQSDGVISSFDRPVTASFSSAYAEAGPNCGLSSGATQLVWDEADDLFPGVDFATQPNHLIVLVPDECVRGSAAGYGQLGKSLADGGKVLGNIEGYGLQVIGHELGHNLSLMHANRGVEYGDYYSVMGGPPVYDLSAFDLPVLNSAQRGYLGLLGGSEVADVELPQQQTTMSQSFTIAPRGDLTGTRSVLVRDPDTFEEYYLDYRSGAGREADTFYQDGTYTRGTLGPGLQVIRPSDDRSTNLLTHVQGGKEAFTFGPGSTFTSSSGAVSVAVTSMDASGLNATVTLNPTRPAFPDPPAPVLTGAAEVGGELQVDVGSWPEGTSHEYRWIVDGEVYRYWLGDPYDQPSLPLGDDLQGTVISVVVVTRDDTHRPVRQVTGEVGPVLGRIILYPPYFAGTPHVGQPYTASAARATPDTATISYQWNVAGNPVPGATSLTYTPQAADAGSALSITATAILAGYVSDTQTSSSSPRVVPATVPVLHAGYPSIGGPARLGGTLTADPGTWPEGPALALQWLRDDIAVPGATGPTYALGVDDVGARFRVRVSATKAGYQPASAESFETGPVAPGKLTSPRPSISGQAKVGKSLTASASGWTPGTTLTFDWYLGATVIGHGTTLKLPKKASGKKVYVRVTGSLPGYQTVSESSPSVKVKPKKKKHR